MQSLRSYETVKKKFWNIIYNNERKGKNVVRRRHIVSRHIFKIQWIMMNILGICVAIAHIHTNVVFVWYQFIVNACVYFNQEPIKRSLMKLNCDSVKFFFKSYRNFTMFKGLFSFLFLVFSVFDLLMKFHLLLATIMYIEICFNKISFIQ